VREAFDQPIYDHLLAVGILLHDLLEVCRQLADYGVIVDLFGLLVNLVLVLVDEADH
jgi:hypothetical protein